MPDHHRPLTRADLPDVFTPESLRGIPMSELGRLARPGNGVLSAEEQPAFDAALHSLMSDAARRVSRQMDRADWKRTVREARGKGGRPGGVERPTRVDQQLHRLARGIEEQVDRAEALAPAVDWSFAQADQTPATPVGPDTPAPADTDTSSGPPAPDGETVADLEQRLTEQVELVQVMSEIAEVGKRTFALEQQRDLQTTRGVFFGFVVSVAVLVAGWAPLVAAHDWAERAWTVGLTLATCVVAGIVYALVRRWQNRHRPAEDTAAADTAEEAAEEPID